LGVLLELSEKADITTDSGALIGLGLNPLHGSGNGHGVLAEEIEAQAVDVAKIDGAGPVRTTRPHPFVESQEDLFSMGNAIFPWLDGTPSKIFKNSLSVDRADGEGARGG
jgi:hypothetical protein